VCHGHDFVRRETSFSAYNAVSSAPCEFVAPLPMDVHDESTSALMQVFYKSYIQTGDMAGALQSAMKQLAGRPPTRISGPLRTRRKTEWKSSGKLSLSPYIFTPLKSPYFTGSCIRGHPLGAEDLER